VDLSVRDAVVVVLLAVGSLFGLLSAIGIVRLPDVFMRMHAMAKATTFGLGCLLMAAALVWEDIFVASKCLVALALLFATLPVAAQIIGRAAVHSGVPLSDRTVVNDLESWLSEGATEGSKGDEDDAGGAESP
jgi:multicomponent Na+:H+ antiporter subunit G